MAKIERKYMAHYLEVPGSGSNAQLVRLGKDLEEYSPEMGANVEKKKNILGETSVMLTGYEKSGTVEPYYAEKGDPLFTWLQGLVDEQKVLDDCATKMVEVHLWEEATEGAYPAIQDEVVVEVSGYGGDNTGYQLPFNVHYLGKPVKGTFDSATKKFTPGGSAPA